MAGVGSLKGGAGGARKSATHNTKDVVSSPDIDRDTKKYVC